LSKWRFVRCDAYDPASQAGKCRVLILKIAMRLPGLDSA
jgi:hypothetical protein